MTVDIQIEDSIVKYIKDNLTFDAEVTATPDNQQSIFARDFNNSGLYVCYIGSSEYILNPTPQMTFATNRKASRRSRFRVVCGSKSFRRDNNGLLFLIEYIRNLLTNYQPTNECLPLYPISDYPEQEPTADGKYWGEVVFETII